MDEICECKSTLHYVTSIIIPMSMALMLVLVTGGIIWPVVILLYLTVDKILNLVAPVYSAASSVLLWIMLGAMVMWYLLFDTVLIYG